VKLIPKIFTIFICFEVSPIPTCIRKPRIQRTGAFDGRTTCGMVRGTQSSTVFCDDRFFRSLWSIDIVTPVTKKVASVSMFGSTVLVRNWSPYHVIGVEWCNVNIYYQSISYRIIRCD
jgi:hypothetical protein